MVLRNVSDVILLIVAGDDHDVIRKESDKTNSLTVNILKGKLEWDASPQFDVNKDKAKFRRFEAACDHVKCVARFSTMLF